MKYINRSRRTVGKWAQFLGCREYSSWSWGEYYVVLGAMQRVKVSDKVMNMLRYFILVMDIMV